MSTTVSCLQGQVALVTGCGRRTGIGQAVARALAGAGADVAITDVVPAGRRNAGESETADNGWGGLESLAAAIEALGRRCRPLVGDVGVKHDAERLVAEAADHLGPVDVLVNNAAAPHGADRAWTWEVP